ncbi:MAG: zinc-dependent metalloprotease, partial [Polyangiaceae bacterium]
MFGLAAVAAVIAGAQGCVADRPSRNGVFDENQYIRKDFLIQPGTGGGDPGWFMKATIVQTSTPNPFATIGMYSGAESAGTQDYGNIVRFVITSDKMDIVDMRETANTGDITAQDTRTPEVVNAWPITNVDLKYRVNLDGEKTNFYEENQELDWQVRQWVKVNFDKNDLSDVAALGPYAALYLDKCGDTVNSSATLVPNSFVIDTTDSPNYMTWTVAVTVPVNMTDNDCMTMFGNVANEFVQMNRSTVTLNLMYSFVRANTPGSDGYTPFVLSEKDNIRHKYGAFENIDFGRDVNSGLTEATEYLLRYNPNAPIVWYFAQGYPQAEQAMWTRSGGIVDQTNAIFAAAGAKATLSVLNYNDLSTFGDAAGPSRQYGDIRYNFIRWESDLDTSSPFIGVTQFQPDPRNGELVSASINIASAPLKDFVEARVEAYMTKVIGTDPFTDPPPDPNNPGQTLPTNCTVGQTIPLITSSVQANIYATSTLYQKMAQYLPPAPDGAASPGPSDYVYNHTGADGVTFYNAYLELLPYTTYFDPTMNAFTTTDGTLPTGPSDLLASLSDETAFQQSFSNLDHGISNLAVNVDQSETGMQTAYQAVDAVRQLIQGHRNYNALSMLPFQQRTEDTTDLISFPLAMSRAVRQCIDANGSTHWETRAEWETALLESYNESVVWHEFGHVMGMRHNFYGSVDKNNWPTYTDSTGTVQFGKFSSSIMDYSQTMDDTFWNSGTTKNGPPQPGWLPYDQGAIGFIYGNALSAATANPKTGVMPAAGQIVGISGQINATAPWNDPLGWTGTGASATEKQFLFCTDEHIRYTPLCRKFDLGSTPSEITAADIESYEWNYNWRNFRQYYKTWDDSQYAVKVANTITDMRRFPAMQAWDWSPTELTAKLIQVGIVPPASAANSGLFYQELTNAFQADVGAAELLDAAFHEAIIQQSTGERPYETQYDPYFGDVTQQGISADKEISFINWLGLWPYDNYDPS